MILYVILHVMEKAKICVNRISPDFGAVLYDVEVFYKDSLLHEVAFPGSLLKFVFDDGFSFSLHL